MNKKIIGLVLTTVFVSFNCVFAMDRSYYRYDGYGAPNDPALIEYYLALFEKERQEKRERLEQEQAEAKKKQERKTLSHETQMQEYVARHRERLVELEDQGKVIIVVQENNNQEGKDDEVLQVERLFDDLKLSSSLMSGFTVSTRADDSEKQLRKRDDWSRPEADAPAPKRRPLLELFEEVRELSEQEQDPVVVVLGQKRGKNFPPEEEAYPTAKKRKGD